MKEGESLHSSYVAICVFNVFLSYTAIMLNSVTIHALRKTSSLPKPLKTLLLSLAVSDLGVGLLAQPLHIAVTVTQFEQNIEDSQYYSATHTVFLTTAVLLLFASFFGVMALSADRFLAIHFYLRYQELVTHKRVVAVTISIWVFGAVLSFLRVFIERNISYVIFTIFLVAFLLTTVPLNYKIYVAVRHHANQVQSLQVQQEARNSEIENTASLRKFAVGTFIVYVALLVCYLPHVCTLIAFTISGPTTTIKGFRLYTWTLLFLNSSLNPLIYCWKLRHIRHAVINILRNIWRSHNMNEIQPVDGV